MWLCTSALPEPLESWESTAEGRTNVGEDLSSPEDPPPESLAGTPRIAVVFGVSLFNYISHTLIRYSTPLYFNALGYPEDTYVNFVFYWLTAFIAGSSFSGLLASRYGERRVWSGSLLLFAGLGLLLIHIPGHWMIPFSGLLYGLSAAGQWVGVMAFVQTVTPSKRGRANSFLMIALGAGSFIGAPLGRLLIGMSSGGAPTPEDFALLFWSHVLICVLGAVLVSAVSRHPGPAPHQVSESSWRTNVALLKMPRYLAIVIPLSLMGGPVFQTVNIYLPYRAGAPEIGLMAGAVDQGWAALLTAGYGFQFLGGLAILLIAGRKAGAGMATGVLAAFAVCSLGIGFSPNAYALFVFVALFEFVRQLMRWSQTGYVSEHMPIHLRGPAIGFSTTLSGLSSTLFAYVIKEVFPPGAPNFSSSLPFFIGGSIGVLGALLLLISNKALLKASPPREQQRSDTT